MTYDVWRMMTGERAGNVDYLGTLEAESDQSAEDQARLMFDCDPNHEYLEVEKCEEESDVDA